MVMSIRSVRSGFVLGIAACGLGLWVGAGEAPAVPATGPSTAPASTRVADMVEPTRISLHLKEVATEDAVAELGKVAGLKFSVADAVWDAKGVAKSISFDVDEKPFWEVLLAMCDKSGLMLLPAGYNAGGNLRIPLSAASQYPSLPASVAKRPRMIYGPFMVTADSMQRVRNLGGDVSMRDAMTVQMTVYCEPRMRVGQMGQLAIDEAVDENGLSLVAENGRGTLFYSGGNARNWSYSLYANLQVPAEAGRKIAHLKGKLPLVIITRMETLEFPDITTITEGVHKTLGDCTYTVSPLKAGAQKDSWELQVMIERDNALSGGREVGSSILQTSQLVDAEGNTWRGGGASGTGSPQKMTYQMTYFNQNFGGQVNDTKRHVPSKFVMEIPTQTREMVVPVEFKDIPMP